MRELTDFSTWADAVIQESLQEKAQAPVKREIPTSQDVMYQATRKYRDLSPEQALSRFLADKLEDFDRRDLDQNKVINRQRQENEKLRGQVTQIGQELENIEAHSAESDRELERIKQLGGKLQTDVETRRVGAREVQEIMAQVEALKNKEGMDPQQFEKLKSQVEDQIKDFQTKGVNPEKFAELNRRLDAMSQVDRVDRDELARVQDLVGKVETGQREIETGRIDVAAKLADLEQRQDDIEQREKNIDKEIDAKVVQAAVRAGRRGTQAEYKRSKERLNKLEDEIIPQLAAAEKAHSAEIEGIKDHDRIQDELIRDLHPQKAKVSAIKTPAHPENMSWYQQELLRRSTAGDARKMLSNPDQDSNAIPISRDIDQDEQARVAESLVYEQPEPEISDEENFRVAAHYARQFAPIFYSEFEMDPNKRRVMRRYSRDDVIDAITYSTYHWLLRIGRYAVRDEERVWATTLEILVEQHPHIEHDDLVFDKNKKFKGQTRVDSKPYGGYGGQVIPPRVSPNPDDGEGPGVKESRLPKKYTQAIDDMAAQILGDQYTKYLT